MMMKCDRRTCGRGGASAFTLIEVLLAAAILGTAMSALLVGASRCLSVISVSRNYQTAIWTLGLGDLDHPVQEAEELDDLNVDGERYENGMVYSREVEKEDEDEDGLVVMRTRVTWSYQDRKAVEEVVSYVLVPEDDE